MGAAFARCIHLQSMPMVRPFNQIGSAQEQEEEGGEVLEHVSEHWGHHGEMWTPNGRILDVSNAGFEVSH